MASVSAFAAFVSPLRRRLVSEPTGAREPDAAVFVPGGAAGGGGTVLDGGGGGGPSAPASFGPPCERRTAERVMSRDPLPGQVMTPFGSESGPIGVLQRGQFISLRPGSWNGTPRREYNVGAARAMEPTRDPDLAARLFGSRPEHTLALLRAAWPVAVGPDLARRTEVVALDRGIVRVKVPDLRWQRSLLRMRGDILSRLRAVAGGAAPRGLGFVVGPVAGPPEPAPAPGAVPPAPAPSAVAEAAAAIPDAEIREGFEAAAARYLARFGANPKGAGPGGGSSTG